MWYLALPFVLAELKWCVIWQKCSLSTASIYIPIENWMLWWHASLEIILIIFRAYTCDDVMYTVIVDARELISNAWVALNFNLQPNTNSNQILFIHIFDSINFSSTVRVVMYIFVVVFWFAHPQRYTARSQYMHVQLFIFFISECCLRLQRSSAAFNNRHTRRVRTLSPNICTNKQTT